MSGRIFLLPFENISISAVQDLWEILVGTNSGMILHGFSLGKSGEVTSENVRVAIRRVTGAPTSGSGGGSITPAPGEPGDTASSGLTVERNNTTQITGGTSTLLWADAQNLVKGIQYLPIPESRLSFTGGTRCVISLDSAPGGARTCGGVATVEVIG